MYAKPVSLKWFEKWPLESTGNEDCPAFKMKKIAFFK
jgi:hypothetical protein